MTEPATADPVAPEDLVDDEGDDELASETEDWDVPAEIAPEDEGSHIATLDERPIVVSAFAGIGGFDLGWERAGFQTGALIEWDKAASRVLAARFPNAARFSDVRNANGLAIRRALGGRRVSLLCGGFPCQDLSVAGRRAGLAGARSGLYGELLRLREELDPDLLVVENVPGLLSSPGGGPDTAGRDFSTFLGDLTGFYPAVPKGGWRSSGVCHGPDGTAAWRVLDSRYFGVAQRRRRVFVVFSPRDRRAPAEVLLEPEGLRGHPAPGVATWARAAVAAVEAAVGRRLPGAHRGGAGGVAPADPGVETVSTLAAGGGERGWRLGAEEAAGGQIVPMPDATYVPEQSQALLASGASIKWDPSLQTYIGHNEAFGGADIAPAVTSKWSKGSGGPSGDETGNMVFPRVVSVTGEQTHALTSEGADASEDGTGRGTPLVPYAADVSPTLRTQPRNNSNPVTHGEMLVSYPVELRGREDGVEAELGQEEIANTVRTNGGGSSRQMVVSEYVPDVAASLTAGSHAPGVSAPGRRQEDEVNLVVEPSIGFSHTQGMDPQAEDEVTPTLRAGGAGMAVKPGTLPMSARITVGETAATLMAQSGENRGGQEGQRILDANTSAVRRLTPRECDRLQGFPPVLTPLTASAEAALAAAGCHPRGDGTYASWNHVHAAALVEALHPAVDVTDWTVIPGTSDSARYKQLGNAVCVNVAEWIGHRAIHHVRRDA